MHHYSKGILDVELVWGKLGIHGFDISTDREPIYMLITSLSDSFHLVIIIFHIYSMFIQLINIT